MTHTVIGDLVQPEVFNRYTLVRTAEKTAILTSGIMQSDGIVSQLLLEGNTKFNLPFFKDLDNANDGNIMNELVADQSVANAFTGGVQQPAPANITAANQQAVRLYRSKYWAASQLSRVLSNEDPLRAIGELVSTYWAFRLQQAAISVMVGLFNDNEVAPDTTEHVLNDLTNDLTVGGTAAYVPGVTDFSAEAVIDTLALMGDSESDLGIMLVHSKTFARMRKNNLIDFVSDSVNGNAVRIPYFLERRVIVSDKVPFSHPFYEVWFAGAGILRFGAVAPDKAVYTQYYAEAANGVGEEVLFNRVMWCIHPDGHTFTPAATLGGPLNGTGAGSLEHLASWKRVYPERKQIKIARLLTREA